MDELCASLPSLLSTPDEILFVWRFTVSDQIYHNNALLLQFCNEC